MVPDLARMSVIIKSQHETSVMTGNYEMGYACGLLCKLAGREVPQWETPVELKDRVAELLTGYEGGLGIANYNDLKETDIIEAYIDKEVER